jgi:glucose/arabinose dehydrogenase/mono/diheme cytochrome c family protein
MRLFDHVDGALVFCAAALALFVALVSTGTQSNSANPRKGARCPNDTGLRLPSGFCATVFADGIGHARHLVVAPDGVVYVNTWSGRYYGNRPPHPGGFLVALQDKTGAGRADVIERFGETAQEGGAGGTGIGIYKNWIYAESKDRIVRYALSPGSIVPGTPPETIVSGLPLTGDHPMHPFIIDSEGWIYVDVASATNSCQVENRQPESPGRKPCAELETRGGIWRYSAKELNQEFSSAARYTTGIRNAEGFGIDSAGRMFVTQQGRDQLHANWPNLYKPSEEATLPAEELLLLKPGGDYGWPECYCDALRRKLVLAPEYGGDGGQRIGICASKIAPVAAFPAHWAPNGMALYNKDQFPVRYRGGVFIAFHGSWDRAPYPQGGYDIVFQPLRDGRASGTCEVFADGFAGSVKSPGRALHRPSGVAVGPHGSLYVADDVHGTIYRIVYNGGAQDAAAAGPPCPSPSAPAGPVAEGIARPPEGTHPNAGAAAARNLPVPPGATPAMVALGDRIYHGQAGGAPCTACHGQNGAGSPLGPDLTAKKYLWSNRSYAGIMKTIREGVPHPKQYRSPMPAMGGARLTANELRAVTAYVWALSH